MARLACPLCWALLALLALAGCGGGEGGGGAEERIAAAVESSLTVADDSDRVSVAAIEIEGAEASAEATFSGGGFDGQTLAVALVDEGDGWKLDRIVGLAAYDTEALAKAMEAQFEAVSDEVTEAQVECLGNEIRGATKVEVEEVLLGGSQQKFVEFAERCQ